MFVKISLISTWSYQVVLCSGYTLAIVLCSGYTLAIRELLKIHHMYRKEEGTITYWNNS